MEIIDRSDGSYTQERLYLLSKIERLEKDVNEAHKRYRELGRGADSLDRRLEIVDRQVLKLKIRAGYIAAGVGAVVGALLELVKWFLQR